MGANFGWTTVERAERFYIGLDLGQRQDYTAIAVLVRTDVYHPERDMVTWERKRTTEYRLRHLQRVALGTPYPEIVDRVSRAVRQPDVGSRGTLVVDATGVGTPVVDLLNREGLPCAMMPVMITSGEKESRGSDGMWHVPKRELVMRLQVMLQERELRVARKIDLGHALCREMLAMRSRAHGTEFGVWRAGEHDDLVLAVALAAWAARRAQPGVLGVNKRLPLAG